MLRDWGSWDADFNHITARVRERLLEIVHATGTHECVPLQGSGTFSVEAALGTLVPRGGHVLVPQNGAYCQRIARICRSPRPQSHTIDYAEDARSTRRRWTRRWRRIRPSPMSHWCIARPARGS